MARPPIGKRTMTPAERQRRWRKQLRKEQLALGYRAEKEQRRRRLAETYIPMPPGLTYWHTVEVLTAAGPRQIHVPITKPLPSINVSEWDNNAVLSLLRKLTQVATARGLEIEPDPDDRGEVIPLAA